MVKYSQRKLRFLFFWGVQLDSYPEFEGREAHYLKAILARVTAGSQVSPQGYYRRTPQLDEDEEDVDEEEEEDDCNHFGTKKKE